MGHTVIQSLLRSESPLRSSSNLLKTNVSTGFLSDLQDGHNFVPHHVRLDAPTQL